MIEQTRSAGTLFVVATPIGNLSDLSERAREVLAAVAVVAVEDTRHSGAMLKHLGIEARLISLHEHNEARRTTELLARLQSGESVALVSDAGTPLISDPGFDLVRAAIAHGIRVSPIPGPCAVIAALSAAGLPSDRFAFEGFLPSKAAQRRERLASLLAETRTLIFYEAPHRLAAVLSDIGEMAGDRRVVIARELTKQFETLYYGSAKELAARAQRDEDMVRGEFVILPKAQAAKLAARLTGVEREELYRRALELSGKNTRRGD
jgi:16S rRNA (cytidine1402-2'-O)-methyltransferase